MGMLVRPDVVHHPEKRGRHACHNADGTRKVGFRDRVVARKVARSLGEPGRPLKMYWCNSCDHYHVGRHW